MASEGDGRLVSRCARIGLGNDLRARVCVCVCVREREREGGVITLLEKERRTCSILFNASSPCFSKLSSIGAKEETLRESMPAAKRSVSVTAPSPKAAAAAAAIEEEEEEEEAGGRGGIAPSPSPL